ncbi:MAG: hypothetical protein RMJ52_10815 [Gemmataceae bacterium]|nr:hypothetical protein [Gemmataceae bacterium]
MTKRQPPRKQPPQPRMVRRTVLVEADRLDKARKQLGLTSDAAVIRRALEDLFRRLEGSPAAEEE